MSEALWIMWCDSYLRPITCENSGPGIIDITQYSDGYDFHPYGNYEKNCMKGIDDLKLLLSSSLGVQPIHENDGILKLLPPNSFDSSTFTWSILIEIIYFF